MIRLVFVGLRLQCGERLRNTRIPREMCIGHFLNLALKSESFLIDIRGSN